MKPLSVAVIIRDFLWLVSFGQSFSLDFMCAKTDRLIILVQYFLLISLLFRNQYGLTIICY
jgi:hypothetical protein